MPEADTATVRDPRLRYTRGAVILHWLTAALVVVQIYVGYVFQDLPRGSPAQGEWFTWHKTLGILILLLALIRLAWRIANPPPPFPAELAHWERLAATLSHRIFYVLLIAIPLTGLAAVSAGKTGTTDLLGGIALPLVPGLPEAWGQMFGDWHVTLIFMTFALLALHVGAALKHQFIDRNRIAGRMPPFRSPDDDRVAAMRP